MTAQRQAQLDAARMMAESLSNLTTFHAVIALMESGLLYPSKSKVQQYRIISLAKKAARDELRRYDAERAVVEGTI